MDGAEQRKAEAAAAGKKVDLTPEEKKAQREAVKAEKAAKKAAAAAKKAGGAPEEVKEKPAKQEKKKDKPAPINTGEEKAAAPEPKQKQQAKSQATKKDAQMTKAQSSGDPKKVEKLQEGQNLKKNPTEPVGKNGQNQDIRQSLQTIYELNSGSATSQSKRKESILGNVQLVKKTHQSTLKLDRMNPSKIANSYYTKEEQADSLEVNVDLHPAIKECGLKLISGDQLQSTNQVTVAILLAMYELIKDFQPQKRGVIFHQELLGLLRDQVVPFFTKCRSQLLSGTLNAMDHLRRQITHFSHDCDLETLRSRSLECIDSYIDNRILYAQDLLIRNGLSIISEKRDETILVYGNEESQTIESLLVAAANAGTKRFTVVVVDSAPDYKGRALAKRLSATGIKVKYTLIQMLATIITSVTKVFLATSYVLCNGALVSPTGTAMVACMAHKNNIPVVAVCEAFKFTDRVNLDQLNNNVIGSKHAFQSNYLCKGSENADVLPELIKNNEDKPDFFFNLKYDLTPQKFLSMIVCEIGNIPPHSVPVVIKEFMMDNEEFEQDQGANVDTSSDEEGSAGELFETAGIAEKDDEEDSEEDPAAQKQMSDKMRRIAERKKQLQGIE